MINSMTGFGRFEGMINGRSITLEIKSVNHRYTEFNCRLTRGYTFLEDKLKTKAEYTREYWEDDCRKVRQSPSRRILRPTL